MSKDTAFTEGFTGFFKGEKNPYESGLKKEEWEKGYKFGQREGSKLNEGN